MSSARDLSVIRQAAKSAEAKRDWSNAYMLWQEAMASYPDDIVSYTSATSALINLRRFSEADELIQGAIAQFPGDAELAMHFAWIAERQQEWDVALARWRLMQARGLRHVNSFVGIGTALMELGKLDDSEAAFSNALKQFPRHAAVQAGAAKVALRRQDWAVAEERLAALASAHPGHSNLNWLRQDLVYLRRMDALVPDTAPKAEPRANLKSLDLRDQNHCSAAPELAGILWDFESIGDNCEFAFLQRACAVEPISLLRWAGITIPHLLDGLRQEFSGLEDAENFRLTMDQRGEYFTSDRRWGLMSHTFQYASAVDEQRFTSLALRRMRFLRNKFLDDLRSAQKILVYRRNIWLKDEEIESLYNALRNYGPNTLLCIRKSRPEHPAGRVEVVRDGLLLGYISDLPEVGQSLPHIPRWQPLCMAAHRLWKARAC